MGGRLHIKDGSRSGETFDVSRLGSYTIGRRSRNTLSIKDKCISREHCRIDYDGDNFWLIDCKSHHGTFVNGRRVNRCMLYDGDLLRLGTVEINFSVDK